MSEKLPTLKILIIGDSGVGKSSLLLRFCGDDFNPNQPLTIGVDYKVKKVTVDGNTVKLVVWDTAGQERFRTLTPAYYKEAHGAILVYNVASEITFKNIENWLNELEIYATKPNMVKVIVGNKIDLKEREITKEDGIKLAKNHATLFIECSALTSDGVQSAFEELVRKIIETPGLCDSNYNDRLHLEEYQKPDDSSYKCLGYECSVI